MERSLKRQSQAEVFERLAILFQLIGAIMKWNIVLSGELHELLDGHLTQFGGAPQRDFVLPESFSGYPPGPPPRKNSQSPPPRPNKPPPEFPFTLPTSRYSLGANGPPLMSSPPICGTPPPAPF